MNIRSDAEIIKIYGEIYNNGADVLFIRGSRGRIVWGICSIGNYGMKNELYNVMIKTVETIEKEK